MRLQRNCFFSKCASFLIKKAFLYAQMVYHCAIFFLLFIALSHDKSNDYITSFIAYYII